MFRSSTPRSYLVGTPQPWPVPPRSRSDPGPAGTPGLPATELVFAAGHECVATLHNLVLSVSLDHPSRGLVEDMANEARHRARAYGATGIYVLVDGSHRPRGDESREHITQMLANLGRACRGLACVVEGEGLLAAAKRRMMTLGMGTRGVVPVKVCHDDHEAAAWLLEQMGAAAPRSVLPGHVTDAATGLRERLANEEIAPRRRRDLRG